MNPRISLEFRIGAGLWSLSQLCGCPAPQIPVVDGGPVDGGRLEPDAGLQDAGFWIEPGQIQDLGDLGGSVKANAISESGVVVGVAEAQGRLVPFQKRPGAPLQGLPGLEGEALAISPVGTIVGRRAAAGYFVAMVWTPEAGLLELPDTLTRGTSVASSIGADETVVGTVGRCGFSWKVGENERQYCASPDSGFDFVQFKGVSDTGDVFSGSMQSIQTGRRSACLWYSDGGIQSLLPPGEHYDEVAQGFMEERVFGAWVTSGGVSRAVTWEGTAPLELSPSNDFVNSIVYAGVPRLGFFGAVTGGSVVFSRGAVWTDGGLDWVDGFFDGGAWTINVVTGASAPGLITGNGVFNSTGATRAFVGRLPVH